jgi:hypothetical protein
MAFRKLKTQRLLPKILGYMNLSVVFCAEFYPIFDDEKLSENFRRKSSSIKSIPDPPSWIPRWRGCRQPSSRPRTSWRYRWHWAPEFQLHSGDNVMITIFVKFSSIFGEIIGLFKPMVFSA